MIYVFVSLKWSIVNVFSLVLWLISFGSYLLMYLCSAFLRGSTNKLFFHINKRNASTNVQSVKAVIKRHKRANLSIEKTLG
mmetsp:Transcript_4568/g.5270  ORF Transcript_4568/g.5270 Transcript_4568/m.5270 type:complete len:81 (-) Transcript_4568:1963-2205(-)